MPKTLPPAHPFLSQLLGLGAGDLVSVMGAGGKATVMKRLVREMLDAKMPVLVTSTTNLHALGEAVDASLLVNEEFRDNLGEAARAWSARGAVVWVEKKLPKNMFRGIPVEQVDNFAEEGFGGVLLVKTDGARKRLGKVPGEGEPVIPRTSTHCVVVLSLSAIGRPAGPEILHRFERSLAISGLAPGETIGAVHLVALAAHPESYPSRLPQKAKNALYLSHCNTPEDLGRAQEVWQALPPDLYDLRLTGDSVAGRFYTQGSRS